MFDLSDTFFIVLFAAGFIKAFAFGRQACLAVICEVFVTCSKVITAFEHGGVGRFVTLLKFVFVVSYFVVAEVTNVITLDLLIAACFSFSAILDDCTIFKEC